MRRLVVLLCIAVGISWMVAGCGGGGGGSTTNSDSGDSVITTLSNGNSVESTSNTIVLQKNVKVLPSDGSVEVSAIDDNTVTLVGDVPAVAPGDVLIQNTGNVQFLRKVVSVASKQGKDGAKVFQIETGKAGLQDVFSEAKVDQVEHIGLEQLANLTTDLPGVTIDDPVVTKWKDGKPAKFSRTFHFNNTLLNTSNGSVTLNGSLGVTLDLALVCDVDLLGIHRVKVEPIISTTGTLTATANFTGQIHLHIPITPEIPFNASLGPVPIGPYFQFNTEINGHVDVTAETTVNGTVRAGFGFQFDGSNWTLVKEFNHSFNFVPPHITALDAELDLTFLQGEVGFTVLGMGGSYARADMIRVDTHVKRQNTPKPGYVVTKKLAFNAYVGAWINLGIGPVSLLHHEGQLPPFRLGKIDLGTDFFADPPPPPFPKYLNVVTANGSSHVQYGRAQSLQAYLGLSDNSQPQPVGDPDVTWVSDNPDIIDVSPDGNTCDLIPGRPGTTTIRCVHNPSGLDATITMTLDAPTVTSLTIQPADSNLGSSPTVKAFAKVPLVVTAGYSDGTFADATADVRYGTAPSNPDLIEVSGDGTVFTYAEGDYKVSATSPDGQRTASIDIHVTPPQVSAIRTVPGSKTTATVGQRVQYRAYGAVQDGSVRDLTDQVLWLESDDRVATVDQKGLVSTHSKGLVTIVADDTHGTQFTASQMLVGSATLSGIKISGPNHVRRGDSIDLTATAIFSDGSQMDLTRVVKWYVYNAVATRITEHGRVFGLARGSTYVAAVFGNAYDLFPVFVDDPTSVAYSQSYPSSLQIGQTFGCDVALIDDTLHILPVSAPITLELVDGNGAHLNGTTTVDAVNGIAHFSGLSIDGAVSNGRIRARSSRLTSALGPLLNVGSQGANGYLYVTANQADQIAWYGVDNSSGALTFQGVVNSPTGSSPTGIISTQNDPAHPFMFVTQQLDNQIASYSLDTASGQPTLVNTFAQAGTQPLDLALYNDSALFVADKSSNSVELMAVDPGTGNLFDAGSFPSSGTGPVALQFLDLPGNVDLLFVENFSSNNFTVFAWNELSGMLVEVPGSPFANVMGCSGPRGLAVAPLDQPATRYALYATNLASGNISSFTVDTTAGSMTFGTLTAVASTPLSTDAKGAVATDDLFLYGLVPSARSVFGLAIDPMTGDCNHLPSGFPVSTGPTGTPERAVIGTTSSGTRVLFVSDFAVGASAVSAFRINADGTLTPATQTAAAPSGATGLMFLRN
jgi:6-phosphogluconolactonase (cycloisomerase 2 family)